MSRSGYYDPMIILAYDGYSVGVVDNGLGFSRSTISYLEIFDNTEPLKYQMKIGKTTRSDVVAILAGVHTVEIEHGFAYSALAGEPDDRFDLDHVSHLNVGFLFDESEVLQKVKVQYL